MSTFQKLINTLVNKIRKTIFIDQNSKQYYIDFIYTITLENKDQKCFELIETFDRIDDEICDIIEEFKFVKPSFQELVTILKNKMYKINLGNFTQEYMNFIDSITIENENEKITELIDKFIGEDRFEINSNIYELIWTIKEINSY
jgi:hypothetical protein